MNVKGKTANELRDMGYGVLDAIRDGYNINNEDDRFLVAYKGAWPDTDEFLFMHRPEAKSNMTVSMGGCLRNLEGEGLSGDDTDKPAHPI